MFSRRKRIHQSLLQTLNTPKPTRCPAKQTNAQIVQRKAHRSTYPQELNSDHILAQKNTTKKSTLKCLRISTARNPTACNPTLRKSTPRELNSLIREKKTRIARQNASHRSLLPSPRDDSTSVDAVRKVSVCCNIVAASITPGVTAAGSKPSCHERVHRHRQFVMGR